jgi:hypothetical protein
MRQVPGLPGTGPGTAPAQTRARKGRKEGREEGKRREGAGLRRGKERACGADGSMDRWTEKRARGERREGGLGLGSRQNQKREGNERVAWTAVVAVCFIDRTW